MKPWIVALGLYKSSGGPTKTISSFRKALGAAPMVNFVDPVMAKREEWAMPDATVLQSPAIPGLRTWCKPSSKKLDFIEAQIAKEASLISCHSFFRYHNLWTLRMKRNYGIPYWFVPHGSLDPYVMRSGDTFKKIFLSLGGRKFLDEASCVIFSTEAEWRKAESVYGPINGEVIPWAVDTIDCSQRREKRREIREELKIPEEAKVLLYFGRLHSMKRPLETIQIVSRLEQKDLYLLMIGPDGDLTEKDCKLEASRCGFKNLKVLRPVYGQEKHAYFFASDIYLSLSHRENFNHAAAECLAAGLPVVLSPGNDLRDAVTESDCGWVLKSDNPNEWLKILNHVTGASVRTLRTKGANGSRFVEDALSQSCFKKRVSLLAEKYGQSA